MDKMLPLDLQFDKNGILYKDITNLILNHVSFINYKDDNYTLDSYSFYRLSNNNAFIIKTFNKKTDFIINNEYNMLEKLIKLQNEFNDIDFPIGYVLNNNKFSGLIIPYYKDGLSIKEFLINNDYNDLATYYNHDNDIINNLKLLYFDITNKIQEMYKEKIYYTDIHSGNFLFTQNEIKLIDFEQNWIYFNENEKIKHIILNNLSLLINNVNNKLNFEKVELFPRINSFDELKKNIDLLDKRYVKRI